MGCCKCNMGGEEKCVSKDDEMGYLEDLKNCSVNTICAAVYNCEIEGCSCLEGRCV